MAEGKSDQCWMKEANGMEAACCHLSGDKHIVGWVQVVFPAAAKLGAVMKPFSQVNSQFPGYVLVQVGLGWRTGRCIDLLKDV
jgi:hypothetical protein